MKSASANPKTKPILYLNLRPFVIAGLSAVIFFPPFLRGLFFTPETLITHMISAVVFMFFAFDILLAQKEEQLTFSWLDLALFALLFAYVLSLFNAVNLRAAVGEILELLNALMIYWLVSRHAKGSDDLERVLKVIFFAAVGVAAIGLGAATGLITYPGAFDGKIIMSTLQYKNSLAAYLAMASVIGLFLWVKQQNAIKMSVYALGNLLLLVTILSTQSRGGWLIYPFGIFVFFLGLQKEYTWRSIYYFFLNLGLALPISKLFLARVMNANQTGGLKVLILAAVLMITIQSVIWFTFSVFKRKPLKAKTYRLLAAGGIVYMAIVLSVYFLYSSTSMPLGSSKFLPAAVVNRASTIHGTDPSFKARLEFDKDALKIVRDYPLTGTGAGGWAALYHNYQDSHYFTTEVHNHFFQVWVEAGTIGFLAFLSIWVALGFIVNKLWRKSWLYPEHWPPVWTALTSAVTLGLHSFFDFNLSLFALVIILWGLFGVIRAGQRLMLDDQTIVLHKLSFKPRLWLYCLTLSICAALLFIPANNFYRAGKIGAQGARAMAAQNLVAAMPLMEIASRLDPFTASFKGDLAQIHTMIGLARGEPNEIEVARQYANEAVRLEPYNYKVRSSIATMYLLQGDTESFVEEWEKTLQVDPLEISLYENLADAYIIAAQRYRELGAKDKVSETLDKVPALIAQLEKKSKQVSKEFWQGQVLQVTPRIKFAYGQSLFLQGKYGPALQELQQTVKQKNPPQYANVWLAAAYYKTRNGDEAAKILSQIRDEEKALELYKSLTES